MRKVCGRLLHVKDPKTGATVTDVCMLDEGHSDPEGTPTRHQGRWRGMLWAQEFKGSKPVVEHWGRGPIQPELPHVAPQPGGTSP